MGAIEGWQEKRNTSSKFWVRSSENLELQTSNPRPSRSSLSTSHSELRTQNSELLVLLISRVSHYLGCCTTAAYHPRPSYSW